MYNNAIIIMTKYFRKENFAMKKFSKILAILVALVVIVTAFTVVSLADTEANAQPVVKYDKNYNDLELGASQEANSGGYGYFGVSAQEGSSDNYVLYHHSALTGENTSYLSGLYSYGSTATSITNYPYAVFEFDMMRLTESAPSFTIGTYIKSAAGKVGVYPSIKADSIYQYVSQDTFEWSRITIVFTYHTAEVDGVTTGYCGYVFYVNGEKKLESLKNNSFTYTDGVYNGSAESNWFFTDLRFDAPSGSTSETDKLALDNMKLTMYPQGSTLDEMVKASYPENYEFPYTKTRAVLNGVGYDKVQDALDAAKDGDTVYLREDVTDVVVVNSAVTVEAGEYEFNYTSYSGYVAELADTAYTFSLSEQLATVKWDSCEGECDCYFKDKVGHVLAKETKVPIGQIPALSTEELTFEIVDGLEIIVLGWSYTKGAAEPDNIEAITADDVANGLNLYPVYKLTQYAVEVISKTGDVKYYLENEFVTAFSEAASGSIIKLITDVEFDSAITVTTSNLTLDLNGKSLKRVYYYGNHYVATYSEETGAFTYGTDATYKTATTASDYLFTVKSKINFTVKSSRDGANIYHANVVADSWYYGDELVKREILGYDDARLFYTYGNTMNISISDVSIYASTFIYCNNGNQTSNTVTAKNINFYFMAPTKNGNNSYFFYSYAKSNYTVTVEDSLLYFTKNAAFYYATNASTSVTAPCVTTFKNCDIIKAENATSYGLSLNYKKTADELIFDNCRALDVNASTSISKNGTLYRKASDSVDLPAASGYEKAEISTVTYSYSVPNYTAFQTEDTTALIQNVSLSYPAEKQLDITFNTKIVKPVTVNWMNGEELYHTETVRVGVDSFAAPTLIKELENDLYRDILCQWTNANGVLYTEVEADWKTDVYTFNAVESFGGETKYAPVLKDAKLSFSYVSQFHQLFYLPVVEGMERPTLTGYTPDGLSTVIIDRQEYYLYTFWEKANSIFNTHTITVNYTIDGVDYAAKVDVSALVYADIILSDQTTYAAEAESVANMIRYAYECYEITAPNNDTVAANLEKYSAKITELIGTVNADGSTTGGKYNLNAYTTDFGQVAESDIENYSEHIHSMTFGILGSSGRTIVILTKEATDAGVKILFNGSSGRTSTATIKNSETDADETVTVYYADNQKVYDAIGKINVTIDLPEGEDIVTSYSVAQYITAVSEQTPEVNIDVAKAMYEFGVAAKAYRDSVIDY